MAFEAILFDCDGVVVDSTELQSQAEQNTAVAYAQTNCIDFNPSEVDWNAMKGLGRRDIAARLFGVSPNSDEAEKFRLAAVDTTIEIANEEMPLIEGVTAFVNYLVLRSVKLGLATSSDRRIYKRYSELKSIDFFRPDFIVAFRECKDDKPKPGQYLELMKRMHVEPEKTLVVEDSKSGITAGRYAGARVLALASTKSADYLRQSTDAHFVAENFREAARQIQTYLP